MLSRGTVVETGTKHAARYRGAEPYRHRRVISDHTEFILDTLGYVKPVKLSMHQMPETAVELLCTTDYTSCQDTRCNLLVMIVGAPAKTTLQ